ncbi:MAG: histidine phosphatase family protein [Actinomycetota bacterium]
MSTFIHLTRHAEVHNPANTWYGRLEGFSLSERGAGQAAALARYFISRRVSAVYCSPLTRAMQTGTDIARALDLEVIEEPDLIEGATYLEGKVMDRVLLDPRNLRYFLNPLRPSWGEPYQEIATRMLRAIDRMCRIHPGEEVVAVSHMTPIMVARLRVERRWRRPWMAGIECHLASVTTLELEDDRHVSTRYEQVGTLAP